MKSIVKFAAGVALGCLVLNLGRDAQSQDKPKGPSLPKNIEWKLQALDQAPCKVVSTHFDPKRGEIFWVMELVRDLDVYEDIAHWAPAYKDGKRTRFRFEFQDADGIVMKTVEGRYYGEYVTKAGKRFGAVLESPLDLPRETKTVEALAK